MEEKIYDSFFCKINTKNGPKEIDLNNIDTSDPDLEGYQPAVTFEEVPTETEKSEQPIATGSSASPNTSEAAAQHNMVTPDFSGLIDRSDSMKGAVEHHNIVQNQTENGCSSNPIAQYRYPQAEAPQNGYQNPNYSPLQNTPQPTAPAPQLYGYPSNPTMLYQQQQDSSEEFQRRFQRKRENRSTDQVTQYKFHTYASGDTPIKTEFNALNDSVSNLFTNGRKFSVKKINHFEKGTYLLVTFTDNQLNEVHSFEIKEKYTTQELKKAFIKNGGEIYTKAADFDEYFTKEFRNCETVTVPAPGWQMINENHLEYNPGELEYRYNTDEVVFSETDIENTDFFVKTLVNIASYIYGIIKPKFSKPFAIDNGSADIESSVISPKEFREKIQGFRFRRYSVIKMSSDNSKYNRDQNTSSIKTEVEKSVLYLLKNKGEVVDLNEALPLYGKDCVRSEDNYHITAEQYINRILQNAEEFGELFENTYNNAFEQYSDHKERQALSIIHAVGYSVAWAVSFDNRELAERIEAATEQAVEEYSNRWEGLTKEKVKKLLRDLIYEAKTKEKIKLISLSKSIEEEYSSKDMILYDEKYLYISREMFDWLLENNPYGIKPSEIVSFMENNGIIEKNGKKHFTSHDGKQNEPRVFYIPKGIIDRSNEKNNKVEVPEEMIKPGNNNVFIDVSKAKIESMSMCFLGPQGCGKTVEMQRIMIQLAKLNARVICFDFDSAFGESEIFEQHREEFESLSDRIFLIKEPISCQLLKPKNSDDQVSDDLIISRLCKPLSLYTDPGSRQEVILKEAIKSMIDDGTYFKQGITALKDSLENKIACAPEHEKESIINISKVIKPYIEKDFIREGSSSWKPHRITLLSLDGFSQQVQSFICELILSAILNEFDTNNSVPTYIVFDEVQALSVKSSGYIQSILKRGRKRNLHLLLATQQFASNEQLKSMFSQTNYKFFFYPTCEDLSYVSKCINPSNPDKATAMLNNLPDYGCILKTRGKLYSKYGETENNDGIVLSLKYGETPDEEPDFSPDTDE